MLPQPDIGLRITNKKSTTRRSYAAVAEFASPCEVSAGDGEAMLRTAFVLRTRRSPRRGDNKKSTTRRRVVLFSLVTRSGIEPLLQP